MPDTFQRAITIDTRPDASGIYRGVKLASDYPVDRGDHVEVLDMTGVNLERKHVPLLLDHNVTKQIGVVDNLRVSGKFLIGDLRFGKSSLALEIADDVENGIRRDISIGYSVEDYRDE